MRRPSGYGQIVSPDADRPRWEADSLACGHCNRHVWVKPGTASTVYLILHPDPTSPTGARWVEEPGAACRLCMTPVCLPCHDRGTCTPFERQLELAERGAIVLGAP